MGLLTFILFKGRSSRNSKSTCVELRLRSTRSDRQTTSGIR